MNLKPFSTISSEEWYQGLAEEEKAKVQNQYLSYKQRYTDFQNQVLTSKNRAPNKSEWEQFSSKANIKPEYSYEEEQGLITGDVTKEILLNLTPGAKIAATGAAGAGLLFANAAMRRGPVNALRVAKKQAGYIGIAEKTYDQKKYNFYKDLKAKGADKDTLFKETGVFDFGAGSRYFDLDVVDDYVKNKGKVLKEGYHSLRGTVGTDFPSLLKHVPERDQISYFVRSDKAMKSAGRHDPNTKDVFYNPELGDPDDIIPHEVQHVIQAVNHLASRGYNVDDARKLLDESPTLREQFKLTPAALQGADKFIAKRGPAYSAYMHNVGEMEAEFTRNIHDYIRKEVKAGTSAEQIKKTISEVNPYSFMKASGYDWNKAWTESDVKAAASYKGLYEQELKKLKQEPVLKVKLTKKEKKKVPERYKKQAL